MMVYTMCASTAKNLEELKRLGFELDEDFRLVKTPKGWTPCEYMEDCAVFRSGFPPKEKRWKSEAFCVNRDDVPWVSMDLWDGGTELHKMLWCGDYHYEIHPDFDRLGLASIALIMSESGTVMIHWDAMR